MPTEDAYSSGHLVLSHFGTCMCSNVETNLSWTCLVIGLFEFRTSSVLLFCFVKWILYPLDKKPHTMHILSLICILKQLLLLKTVCKPHILKYFIFFNYLMKTQILICSKIIVPYSSLQISMIYLKISSNHLNISLISTIWDIFISLENIFNSFEDIFKWFEDMFNSFEDIFK